MSASGEFETFNQRIADAMLGSSDQGGGLPQYLGVRLREMTPGRLVATMDVRADLITPIGAIHGGVMAGFVDHCLGCVLYPLMKPGQWAATTEFKLNYLAPVRAGALVADSIVEALGKRTAVVRVEVKQDDRPVCLALGTLLVSDPPSKA